MDQEARDTLYNLAYDLSIAQSMDAKSSVLFLGGGASTMRGHPSPDELQRRILLMPRNPRYAEEDVESMSREDQISKFEQKWVVLPQAVKNLQVRTLYESLLLTEGHIALALLLQEMYFPLVLTTTIDQLIELSFFGSSIKPGKPIHTLRVLENGRDRPDDFKKAIEPSSYTTILKLCGNTRSFAVTRAEAVTMVQAIETSIKEALERDLIIVGCTQLDDAILQHVFQTGFSKRDSTISFFNTEPPSPVLKRLLAPWDPNYIVDDEMNFDLVFQTIAQQLDLVKYAEQAKGGEPLNKEESESLRQATQSSQTSDEALAKFFKPAPPSDTAAQPIAEEQLVELLDSEPEEVLPQHEAGENGLIELVDTTVFTVKVRPDRKASITLVGGKFNYSGPDSDELRIDLEELNWVMHDLGQSIATYHRMGQNEELRKKSEELRNSWRRTAKREGIALYNNLIESFPDLDRMLAVARQAAAQDDLENLTLVFEGPRQFLGMPYELLYYRDEPLVKEHPLCRKVTEGSGIFKDQHFDDFIQTLRRKKQKLRVLLIASGTAGTTSDEQALDLQKLLANETERLNLGATIDVLLTDKASVGEVTNRLKRSTYHIIHYAGHGVFDEQTGENSGLRLWQRENQAGGQGTLTARELATLLGSCEVRLFYLNSCVGAETGNQQLLRDNDYLGMMDAIVRAGIPYVLGFRWYVTDSSSREFAFHFYQSLFKRPFVPERAVLHARQYIYGQRGVNETWTSPILVAQTPYHVTAQR